MAEKVKTKAATKPAIKTKAKETFNFGANKKPRKGNAASQYITGNF